MLGVRREGVTIAAGKLKDMGVIRYNRGRITVLDRPTLESLACECYTAVKGGSDRLGRLPVQRPSRRIPVEAVVTVRKHLTGSARSLDRTLRPVVNASSNGRGLVA